MNRIPKVGVVGEHRFVVESKHAIDFADDELPPVLCTPWLIRHLEQAALEALLPFLEAGESSVGTEIELQHLAPTPLGHTVVCTARVVRAEGSEIWFQLAARDEVEPIARGFHKRHVIRKERFAARVQRKGKSAGVPDAQGSIR